MSGDYRSTRRVGDIAQNSVGRSDPAKDVADDLRAHDSTNASREQRGLRAEDARIIGPNTSRARSRGTIQQFDRTRDYPQGLMIGLDVGSTAVKAVLVDPARNEVLWKDYRRHNTKQAERALEVLDALSGCRPRLPQTAYRLFCTGSGGAGLAEKLGGKFVQEVTAVALAVEMFHPDVRSVVELGGQDSKVIFFKQDPRLGTTRKTCSMNDKCAGGTGAILDKIAAKLGLSAEQCCDMAYNGVKLHPVAGKCGVFAETDINSLQKLGVPNEELMASLFESIVQQNLSVLTRGNTLLPTVLLLGGPNVFIRGMRECWQRNLVLLWKDRGVRLPSTSAPPETFIVTPANGQYYAALGAVEFGKSAVDDDPNVGRYSGPGPLRRYVEIGRAAYSTAPVSKALVRDAAEATRFRRLYATGAWRPPAFPERTVIEGFIGLDGGSTSTKAVLIDRNKTVIAKAYQLSRGHPIEDAIEVLVSLVRQIADQQCQLRVLGVGTTGYAKDLLKDVLRADVALVETVAHAEGGLHYHPESDVIVDVGGQDIKVIVLRNHRVKDFMLNTQCSAGNGYFLQATAASFGYAVSEYADLAFSASAMPEFGYGCAVFMQSDIVDFQRQGWRPHEILAGLAAVLPKNIWLYVAGMPNLAKLGTTFLLQGGTQHNLAAVKAQVDFIKSRFAGTGRCPEVIVHEHCGECGAIGCAIEVLRLCTRNNYRSRFIGMEAVRNLSYRTTRDERTRCSFCKNHCQRTFIDVTIGPPDLNHADRDRNAPCRIDGVGAAEQHSDHGRNEAARGPVAPVKTRGTPEVLLTSRETRLIVGACDKGAAEDLHAMRRIKKSLDQMQKACPNLVDIASNEVFGRPDVQLVADSISSSLTRRLFGKRPTARRRRLMERRSDVRIGIPRVLNLYSLAPFFTGFFTSLGIPFENLVWSDPTSDHLYKAGAKRGSIDPCFPSKLGIAHVHDLLCHKHAKKSLTHMFFPMVDAFPTFLHRVQSSRACPAAVAAAEATRAAFVKEGDLFAQAGIVFKRTFLNLDEPELCARQMHKDWKDELGLSLAETGRATMQGLGAVEAFCRNMRRMGREVIERLEAERRLAVVLLARPYHNDPGVNHGICDELQKRGYPLLPLNALPIDPGSLDRRFPSADSVDPLAVDDVWFHSYSEHSTRKVWAAKYVARHPNLVGLELSSFKCGLDAPIYTAVEEIMEAAAKPFFGFKDIDENRPMSSIKLRIETMVYCLERYRQELPARMLKSPGPPSETQKIMVPAGPSTDLVEGCADCQRHEPVAK